MTLDNRELHVVMYHYVRDLSRTAYPRIKGLTLDRFRTQIAWLASRYEMVTLEVALEFLLGAYKPANDLCMLTFDDGLKEHYTDVAPILSEYKIQGLFGLITSCIEDHIVAPVHMNHFLMAELEFDTYRSAFLQRLRDAEPEALSSVHLDPRVAQMSYPLDTQEVATFKFLFNFCLDAEVRDRIVRGLFREYIGDEGDFSRTLYMNWEEVCQIQRAGMLIAGHTHWHRPLSTLSEEQLNADFSISRSLMNKHLEPQGLWPFSYPYGKKNSYTSTAMGLLQKFGFACAFNTENGINTAQAPLFELNRVDCNDAVQRLQA
jgi:peptidoglycan/xylan/chitin deacetylase (PgdA/CDA1 family)